MIICSEEQFKVLSLPQLRIKHKEKLTAIDGSKVRKLGVISLRNPQGNSRTVSQRYIAPVVCTRNTILHFCFHLRPVVRKLDGAIHRSVIFQPF